MKTRVFNILILPAAALLFTSLCGELNVETTVPVLRVLSPGAGDTLEAGETFVFQLGISDLKGDSVYAVLEGGTLGAPVFMAAFPAAGMTAFPWTVPLSLQTDNRYCITLTSPGDDSLSGSSAFFTIVNYADIYEPDSSAPQAKALDTNGTVQYRTMPGSDKDWCSFSASAGITYCIQTYGSTDTYLELFAPNGIALLSQDDDEGEGLNALIIWECTAAGTYYLRMTAKTTGRPQAYSMNIRGTTASAPAILEIVYPDSGRQFTGGNTVGIEWNHSAGSGTAVSLVLYKGDSAAATIIQGTFNDDSYSWTVPLLLATSPDYRIIIVSDDNPLIGDTSRTFTITNAPVSFTITTPASSAQWYSGSSYLIRWTISGNPGPYARLSLYDNGSFVSDIIASVAASAGQYVWALPWALTTSSGYRIKVMSLTDSAVYALSVPFTITRTPSTLAVTSPVSSTNWNTGTSHYLSWTYSGNPGTYVKLALYNGTALAAELSSGTLTSNGRLLWNILWNLPASSSYRIKITSISDTTIYDFSDYFTLTYVPATITVTAPAAGAVWTAGTSRQIYWASSTTVPGSWVAIYLCDSTQVLAIDPGVNRLNGVCSWTIPATQKGGSSYRVKIVSTEDTSVYGYSGYFTITGQPDRITLTSPVYGSSWTAGDWYTIYWTYSGPGLPGTEVTLELYDSASLVDTILQNAGITNLCYFWQVPAAMPAGNVYRIRISSKTLDTVFDFSDYFSVTNPALIGDKYEPDSTFAQAKPIFKDSAAQSRTLSNLNDADWLKFAAVSGTTYTIETQGSTDTYIDLYGTDGVSLLASDDDSGSSYPNAEIEWTCTLSGTYYFTVAGWDVGSYTVTLK